LQARSKLEQITFKERLLIFRPNFFVFLFKIETRITHLTFRGRCIVIYSYKKTNKMHCFSTLFR